jgi:hypothetical protein
MKKAKSAILIVAFLSVIFTINAQTGTTNHAKPLMNNAKAEKADANQIRKKAKNHIQPASKAENLKPKTADKEATETKQEAKETVKKANQKKK